MKIILFTKIFRDCSAEEVGAAASALGMDGLDLAVRAGQCVAPSNVRHNLPGAIRIWRDYGLTIPMVTLEGNATDPQDKDIQHIYAACAEAGITVIKLGYWLWQPGDDYWQGVGQIRRALEGFQQLGQQYGICSLLHTHSDNHYFANAAGAMHVAHDFDPAYIGVYLDPAHLAADGENMPMALAIVEPYLHMIGVKNVRYVKPDTGSGWVKDWCPLADGLVDWRVVIPLLREAGFDGPLSLHAEYSAHHDKAGSLELATLDAAFLRSLVLRA